MDCLVERERARVYTLTIIHSVDLVPGCLAWQRLHLLSPSKGLYIKARHCLILQLFSGLRCTKPLSVYSHLCLSTLLSQYTPGAAEPHGGRSIEKLFLAWNTKQPIALKIAIV